MSRIVEINYFNADNYIRDYFNSTPDAIILINPQYIILGLNKSATSFLSSNYHTSPKIGDVILNYFEQPEQEIFKFHFLKALAGEDLKLQSFVTKDNNVTTETITFLPLLNDKSEIIGVIYKKAININEKQENSLINENEYRLKLILESTNVGWWDWNLQTGIQQFDDKWWAMLGYEPDEIKRTQNFRNEIYHPDDINYIFTSFNNAVNSKLTNYEIEYRLLHKDGHCVPVLSKGFILRNEQGVPIRVSGINIDISEIKRKEELRQESENYLRNIFQNTEIGYIFIDFHFTILAFNQTAQIIAQNLNDKALTIGGVLLDFVGKERLENFKDVLASVRQGNKIEYDRMVVYPDNEEEWYHLKLAPVFNLQNKVVNIIMTLENITERKKNELQLNKSFDLVNAQNKRLLSFSYIVSHNLRSHASNIISIVDFLSEADTDEERNEMIEHLKSVSMMLDETLINLNEVISIHTNINLIFEPLILNAFIKKATDVLREQIFTKDATIINNVGKDIVINYNPAYIESIILNFISNALKYSHPDRKPVVTISYTTEQNKQILVIADNGIGIDLQKNGEKLFGLYKTFNNNPDARGIGLFITKSQVEFMGGKIEVESKIGIGTTFKIYF